MAAFETLIYEKKDHVAHITLNRPKALNAYNVQMRDDLYAVLGAVKDDRDVRVAVLKGAGEKAFCAGADLSEFLTAPPPVAARKIRWERDIWGLFLSIRQPLIAALHGFILGSGIEISLCCDIRIASDDAMFGLPEIDLGMIPAAGGTQTVPRTIGRGKAFEMLLTNKWLKAYEALECGLVNRVVKKDDLSPAVNQLAEKIANYRLDAVCYAKQAVVKGLDMPINEGLDLEKRLSFILQNT